MSIAISDLERQAIRDGSASADNLKSSYWIETQHISDPEFQVTYLHDAFRANGIAGNSLAMFDGIQRAKAHLEMIRTDRELFNACKPSIAAFLTDLLLPEAAAHELLTNLRPGQKAPKLNAAAARLNTFNRMLK